MLMSRTHEKSTRNVPSSCNVLGWSEIYSPSATQTKDHSREEDSSEVWEIKDSLLSELIKLAESVLMSGTTGARWGWFSCGIIGDSVWEGFIDDICISIR